MARDVILAIDQGTTGTTVLVLNAGGEVVGKGYSEFTQHFPHPGWVEHDAEEIWTVTRQVVRTVLAETGYARRIAAVGITNQRETTVVWRADTGEPLHRAVVWQCRRTAQRCDELKARGVEPAFRARTGLPLDPYFSGTKLEWLLDHASGARDLADAGELRFGTIDSWLLWKLTNGTTHATDYTNASRTLLFNLHQRHWDEWCLDTLNVPESVLPEVRPSIAEFGVVQTLPELVGVPITGIAGDQQAALFGQGCFEPGAAKNTYGTGCFALLHTGDRPVHSRHGLLTTAACSVRGERAYALEGSVFVAGAAVQWLRDELGLISDTAETEVLARSVPDSAGVVVVPAFVGLGAPYWDPDARGCIFGLTRGVGRAHLVRATLESIALQVWDVVESMRADTGTRVTRLMVDGRAAANDFLMQLQADLLRVPVVRPRSVETTARGAAFLAGLGVGLWQHVTDLKPLSETDRTFTPQLSDPERQTLLTRWREAVARARTKMD